MPSHVEVTVKKMGPRTVAFLSVKGPYSKMPDAFRQLFVWTHQKGFQSADTPLAVFFNVPGQVPDDELLWEVQLPIAGGVAPGGPDKQGLGVRLLPEAEMASTMHRGSYSTLEEAYKALTAWLTEHGYEVVGPPEEIYLQGPGKFSAKDFLTEVRFPVRKGQGILGFAKP